MENAEAHDRSPDTHPLGDPEQLPLKHADSSNSIPLPLPPPPLPPVASSESDDLSSPQDDLPEPAAAEEVQEDFHVLPEPAPEPEPDSHPPVFETDADYREGSPSFAPDEHHHPHYHHHHHHYPNPHPHYDPYQPALVDGMEHPADPTQRLSQTDGEREGGNRGSGVDGGIGVVGVGSPAEAAGRGSSSSDGGSSTEIRMEYDMGQPYHKQQQQPPEEGGERHHGSGSLDHLPPGDPIPLTEHTGPKYGGGGCAGGGEDHANQKTNAQVLTAVDEKEVRGENCCEKFLRCLSYVPCGSLIAWIILLLGLGALAGSLIVGTRKARNMVKDEGLLWFMEFSVTGVAVGMFVLGSGFLVAGHLSTEPTSRRVFNSSSKNSCARGFNIFLLVFVYILCLLWILMSTLLATPIVLLVMMYLVTGTFGESDCLPLKNYGFSASVICASDLDRFKDEAKDVLICYGVSVLSSWLVAVSLIHFLICISANITHLRDNRFATLGAYETEEIRNSKGSVLDTNM